MLPLLLALALPAAPAPPLKASGVIVLDDCDPKFDGKAAYEDNLSFLTPAGKLAKRVSGLNICQEIGSPHRIAIDAARKCAWVSETVGGRLMKYSLDGKELLAVPGVKAYGIAIDPATGNVWATRVHGGRLEDGATTTVHSPEGKRLASYPVTGYDMAFDPKNRSMWVVAQDVTRLSLEGKVLARQRVTDYYALSVAPCPLTGNAWVSVGSGGGRAATDHVVAFDKDMKEVARFSTDGARCVRLAVSPRDGCVWAALSFREIRRYSKEGRLEATFKLEVTSLDIDPATGGVWATTPEETLRLTRDGKITARIAHKAKSSQAWIASY